MEKSYSREEAIDIVKEYFEITEEKAIQIIDRNDFSDKAIAKMEWVVKLLRAMENDENDSRLNTNLYERRKAQVYATGNRWAIENFNATH